MTLLPAAAWIQKCGSQEYVTLRLNSYSESKFRKRKQEETIHLRKKEKMKWASVFQRQVSMLNEILKSCLPRRYLWLRSSLYELELLHWQRWCLKQSLSLWTASGFPFTFRIEWLKRDTISIFPSLPHPSGQMVALHPKLMRVSHYKRVKKETKSRPMPYVRTNICSPYGQNKAQEFLMYLCVCVRRCCSGNQCSLCLVYLVRAF